MEVEYTPNSSVSRLHIKDVAVTDEALYKCEKTYLEVRENCDVVQVIKLRTLGKFLLSIIVYWFLSIRMCDIIDILLLNFHLSVACKFFFFFYKRFQKKLGYYTKKNWRKKMVSYFLDGICEFVISEGAFSNKNSHLHYITH